MEKEKEQTRFTRSQVFDHGKGLYWRYGKKKELYAYDGCDILSYWQYKDGYIPDGDDRYFDRLADEEENAYYVWESELPARPKKWSWYEYSDELKNSYVLEVDLPGYFETENGTKELLTSTDALEVKMLFDARIPSTIETLGSYSFRYSGLCEIVIPGSIKSIGDACFYQSPNLCRVTIGEGLEDIGRAFTECPNLKYVVLPNSIKSIDKKAFGEPDVIFFVPTGSKERYAAMLPDGADIREDNVPTELEKEVADLIYATKIKCIKEEMEELCDNELLSDPEKAAKLYANAIRMFPDDAEIKALGSKL